MYVPLTQDIRWLMPYYNTFCRVQLCFVSGSLKGDLPSWVWRTLSCSMELWIDLYHSHWHISRLCEFREKHPLDPQPHRHSMLVPRVCAPRVTWCSLGKYWSRDWFRGNFSLTQGLWNQQAANPGVHMLSMTHSGVRQRNVMTHAQCPLPVYCSQVNSSINEMEAYSCGEELMLVKLHFP